MSKRYEIAEAMAHVAAAGASANVATVKEALLSSTTIPPERIDFAASELVQIIPALMNMAALMRLCLGRNATIEEFAASLANSVWIDDDKGIADVGVRVIEDDGEEVARASVRSKGSVGLAPPSMGGWPLSLSGNSSPASVSSRASGMFSACTISSVSVMWR